MSSLDKLAVLAKEYLGGPENTFKAPVQQKQICPAIYEFEIRTLGGR
jgi:hypothetical protein